MRTQQKNNKRQITILYRFRGLSCKHGKKQENDELSGNLTGERE